MSPQHVRQAPIVPVESPWNLSSKSWVACSWKSSSITVFHTHGIFHTRSAHYGLALRSTASSNKDSKSTTCSGCGGIYHSSPTGAISPKARKVRKYHLTMRLPHTWLQQRKLLPITLCTVNASLLPTHPITMYRECVITTRGEGVI